MSKKNMSVICNRVVVDSTNGRVFIIGKPSQVNAKGAYAFSNQQFTNLAEQAGLSTKQLIRNIAGAKLSFDALYCVAGQPWVNEKTGESGTYGEKNGGKDSWKLSNYSIELSAQKALGIEVAEAQAERMPSGLSFDSFMNQSIVAEPAAVEVEDEVNTTE